MGRALLILLVFACGVAGGWYGREVWSRFAAFSPVAVTSPAPVTVITPPPRGTTAALPQKSGAAAVLPMPSATVLMSAPDDPPRIIAIALSSPEAVGGQVISGTVKTSSNVASVEVRLEGYSASLTKAGVGEFVLAYKVPELPAFLRRTYTAKVIARNTRGDSTSSSFRLTVR